MKIAIYLAGSTYTEIIYRYGDFEDWFARGINAQGFETVTVDVTRGERADLDEIDGIIITGSPASVCTDPAPWVSGMLDHLQDILTIDFPTLGACFGHQVLAAAAGCKVEPHPISRELGTVQLIQTNAGQEHPLFRDIPEQFKVQETHEDIVSDVPNSAKIQVLAGNDYNPYQALSYSDHIFSVQFHPEITADIMQAYIDIYGKKMVESGEMSSAAHRAIQKNVEESTTGENIFRNFCDIIRRAK